MFIGQIGIVPHPHTPTEWLIETVTRSTVHHAVLAISETECVSCEPGGALLRPITRFPDAYWSHFELLPEQLGPILRWANAHVGAPYGWFQDIAIGVALLTRRETPKWLQNYLSSNRSYECAQFCDAAYTYAGIHLFSNIVSSAVYPGMFVPIWQRFGWM